MNISKKTLKKPKNSVKSEYKPINKRIFLIAGIAAVVILITVILFDQLVTKTLFTFDGQKYAFDDLRYYFYMIESEGHEVEKTYQSLFQQSYWDMPYDETNSGTIRDLSKSQAMDMVIKTSILYAEATANGYKLTEDEVKEVNEKVSKLMTEELNEREIKKNKFNHEYLTDVISKITLVTRYEEDLIKSFNINYDEIKETIPFENLRQYEVEYFSVGKNITDEEGNKTPLSDSEKQALLTKLEDTYEKAKTSDKWPELLPAEEKDVKYKTISFSKDDKQLADSVRDTLITLENNQVSSIIEDDNGYYVFKMINNSSTTEYDRVVGETIDSVEQQELSKYFAMASTNYDYKINSNYLSSLRLGKLTIDRE